MPRPRKLTEAEENELLVRYEVGRKHSIKALRQAYNLGRTTLFEILRRARARQSISTT